MRRFNPAPGWPAAPSGWLPDPGWSPDPTWPAAPAGWHLVVEDGRPATAQVVNWPSSVAGSWLAVAAGTTVLIGSALPWIEQQDQWMVTYQVNSGVRALAVLLGLWLVLAALTSLAPGPRLLAALFGALPAAVGACGYALLAIAGWAGVPTDTGFGTVQMHWQPGAGLLLSFLGAVTCAAGLTYTAVRSYRHQQLTAHR
ncbi:hypothetical protein EDD99_0022 [Streptomyces sp. 846.5]|nr:hypothetical protein [Streptomyces sp. 846.5]TDU01660.1 hypothetical protein EDD99_0022 [Streptomyces sp. 846.5]